MIVFHSPVSVGFEIGVNGQRYRLTAVEPHTKRDGSVTELLVWQTECAQCGCAMVTRSPSNRAPDTRRCDLHKAPGRRVRSHANPSLVTDNVRFHGG